MRSQSQSDFSFFLAATSANENNIRDTTCALPCTAVGLQTSKHDATAADGVSSFIAFLRPRSLVEVARARSDHLGNCLPLFVFNNVTTASSRCWRIHMRHLFPDSTQQDTTLRRYDVHWSKKSCKQNLKCLVRGRVHVDWKWSLWNRSDCLLEICLCVLTSMAIAWSTSPIS